MIDFEDVHRGDKVRIVSEWLDENGTQNHEGKMDKYLGAVMTVREVHDGYLKMEEDSCDDRSADRDGWFWFEDLIDCVIGPELASDEDFANLLNL